VNSGRYLVIFRINFRLHLLCIGHSSSVARYMDYGYWIMAMGFIWEISYNDIDATFNEIQGNKLWGFYMVLYPLFVGEIQSTLYTHTSLHFSVFTPDWYLENLKFFWHKWNCNFFLYKQWFSDWIHDKSKLYYTKSKYVLKTLMVYAHVYIIRCDVCKQRWHCCIRLISRCISVKLLERTLKLRI
jgi:hypothetical protein